MDGSQYQTKQKGKTKESPNLPGNVNKILIHLVDSVHELIRREVVLNGSFIAFNSSEGCLSECAGKANFLECFKVCADSAIDEGQKCRHDVAVGEALRGEYGFAWEEEVALDDARREAELSNVIASHLVHYLPVIIFIRASEPI